MEEWKKNVHFTLVTPSEPGNIGASARAIKNMGFRNLELVAPPDNFTEGHDFWLACQATELLREARVYDNIESAIKDKSIVVGTSRRLGKRRGLLLPLKEGVKEILKGAGRNSVAILFGREDRGLTNEIVNECGFLIHIPTYEEAPSLNLAQAVLLVAYELACQSLVTEMPDLVTSVEMKPLFEHIRKTLGLLGYIPRGNRDMEERIMRSLKQMIGRSGLTPWELSMLHGICGQIERRMGKD